MGLYDDIEQLCAAVAATREGTLKRIVYNRINWEEKRLISNIFVCVAAAENTEITVVLKKVVDNYKLSYGEMEYTFTKTVDVEAVVLFYKSISGYQCRCRNEENGDIAIILNIV